MRKEELLLMISGITNPIVMQFFLSARVYHLTKIQSLKGD